MDIIDFYALKIIIYSCDSLTQVKLREVCKLFKGIVDEIPLKISIHEAFKQGNYLLIGRSLNEVGWDYGLYGACEGGHIKLAKITIGMVASVALVQEVM